MSTGITVVTTGGTPNIMNNNNTRPAAAISNPPVAGSAGVERRCESNDCNVSKLVAMVPKRKTSQFVTEPNVMDKPMLINGFTTVFQVDGASAKLSDLKNPNGGAAVPPKTIFRIVPNTHAHIVNYVVVDADGDSLRKINESDPATMRKLLESQKVSADQMLRKLMAGTPPATASVGTAAPAAISATATPAHLSANIPTPTMPVLTPVRQATTAATKSLNANTSKYVNIAQKPKTSTPPPLTSSLVTQQQNTAIKLPVRMHPNLKITAVASADSVAALNVAPPPPLSQQHQAIGGGIMNVAPTVPLITPVPLANLQNAIPAAPTSSIPSSLLIQPVAPPPQPSAAGDTIEKPVFDKMQAELQELRRTVALLAEAQAKNNQQQQLPTVGRPLKRPRQI